MTGEANSYHGFPLGSFVAHATTMHQVYKNDVRVGDLLYVITENSAYHLRAIGDGWYVVSGGWFDRNRAEPQKIRIAGCSWGGSVIKVDVVAAVGLSLEFANRVTTSPIKKIILIPGERQN